MSEHKNKIIVTIFALILVIIALFSQRGPVSKESGNKIVVKEEKEFTLLDTSQFKESDQDSEYVVLNINPTKGDLINVSKITIENKSGQKFLVGDVTKEFSQAKLNQETPLLIANPSTLIISSGKSPVGVSFKENLCTGFLNQYQTFSPPLEEDCPSAESIIKNSQIVLDDSCQEFIKTIPRCQIVNSYSADLGSECIRAISESVNYNQCVESSEGGANFYQNKYRIYLGSETEIFSNTQDLIKIIDEFGDVVESKLLLKI